ncbi:hypothetical protein K438DRAFT_2025482 [Mycena galopus ATCC 62051]|nr:hypothetical protein K438DRAFT_2025482 [Mycena galopus ATCC 62051]
MNSTPALEVYPAPSAWDALLSVQKENTRLRKLLAAGQPPKKPHPTGLTAAQTDSDRALGARQTAKDGAGNACPPPRFTPTEKALEADKAQLLANQKKLESDQKKLEQNRGRKQLKTDRTRLDTAREQLETERTRLANLRAQLTAGQAKLDADRALSARQAMADLQQRTNQLKEAEKRVKQAEREARRRAPRGRISACGGVGLAPAVEELKLRDENECLARKNAALQTNMKRAAVAEKRADQLQFDLRSVAAQEWQRPSEVMRRSQSIRPPPPRRCLSPGAGTRVFNTLDIIACASEILVAAIHARITPAIVLASPTLTFESSYSPFIHCVRNQGSELEPQGSETGAGRSCPPLPPRRGRPRPSPYRPRHLPTHLLPAFLFALSQPDARIQPSSRKRSRAAYEANDENADPGTASRRGFCQCRRWQHQQKRSDRDNHVCASPQPHGALALASLGCQYDWAEARPPQPLKCGQVVLPT